LLLIATCCQHMFMFLAHTVTHILTATVWAWERSLACTAKKEEEKQISSCKNSLEKRLI